MTDVCLALEGIGYRRGDARVLHDVNWTVRSGEHWAVLGPNGSGKTTLMMIATGYEHSSMGEVFLLDGYVGDIVLPEVRLKVGFVSAQLTEVLIRNASRTTGLEIALSGRYASLGLFQRPSRNALRDARRVMARRRLEAAYGVPLRLVRQGRAGVDHAAGGGAARAGEVSLQSPSALGNISVCKWPRSSTG